MTFQTGGTEFKRLLFSNTGLRFKIVTDTHYAAADTEFNRYFHESTDGMTECVDLMNG